VIYRIAQESLTNAVRHARASRIEVALGRTDTSVVLRIADNGQGRLDGTAPEGGGIRSMRERALQVSGDLTIDQRPGGGTVVRFAVPTDVRSSSRDHGKGGWAIPIPTKTRVLLADDHGIVRRGIRLVLDAEPDIEVVAEAANSDKAVDLAAKEDIQLAILDVAMPRLTGLQAAREISRRRPDVRILMLSMYDNEEYLFEALKAGASGYVLKSGADQDLVRACRAAMRGEAFLYPKAITTLIRAHLERTKGDEHASEVLTQRELEIVKLVAEGRSTKKLPTSSSSAPRPSSDTGLTSWRSWRCETGSNSPDTPYGEASSSPESSPGSRPAGCARTAGGAAGARAEAAVAPNGVARGRQTFSRINSATSSHLPASPAPADRQ